MTDSRPRSAYTYPARVSDQLQRADTGDGNDAVSTEFADYFNLVKDYCFSFSKTIESEIHRTFVPYLDSKSIFFRDAIKNRRHFFNGLKLSEDLLAIDSITFMDTVLTSSQYRLLDENGSPNGYPFREIQFDSSGLPGWDSGFNSSIDIVGEWGLQDSESDAYSTVTTVAEALDASETVIDLAADDGDLFEVFQYIRIDDELMLITTVTRNTSPALDTITVVRGANGFTATIHDDGASITRWNVVDDVRLLATRMVAYWFGKRDDKGERVQVIDNALVIAEFSKELKAIAERRQINKMGKV